MSRRVYVCPIVGTGQDDDPFRPLLADIEGVEAWSAAIGSVTQPGKLRGQPREDWTLVRAEAADWTAVEANEDCTLVSDAANLDRQLASETRVKLGAQTGVAIARSGTDVVDMLLKRQYPYAKPERFIEQVQGHRRIKGGALEPFVEDTFTDTNGTALQGHAPDVGGDWQALGFIGDNVGSSSINAEIVSNSLFSASSTMTGGRAYRNTAEPPSAEYVLTATARWGSSGAGARRISLLARQTPTDTASADVDRYVVYGDSSNFNGTIAKVINGSRTTLAFNSTNFFPTNVDCRMEFDVTDDEKVFTGVRLDTSAQVIQTSTEDNDIEQVGRVGIAIGPGSNAGVFAYDFLAEGEGAAIEADGEASLPALAVSGEGDVPAKGDGEVTLPSLIADSEAQQALSGEGEAALTALVATGNGEIEEPSGEGTATLPALSAAGDATQGQEASGDAALAALIAEGTGSQSLSGQGEATIGALVASGEGEMETPSAAGEVTLPSLVADGDGSQAQEADGQATLPALIADGTGEQSQAGAGEATLPSLLADATGAQAQDGDGEATLPSLTAAGDATHFLHGDAAATLAALIADATGIQALSGDGGAQIPALIADGIASPEAPSGAGSGMLPALVGGGEGAATTVQGVRPVAVIAAGAWTAEPSGTLAEVTSDRDPDTYAQLLEGDSPSTMILQLGTLHEPVAGGGTLRVRVH